ncbi:hypothetical protein [Humisphaera borealis]|uniref:Uncharacterized protein n=1 Tax=Humisphaera borealis TaxID=2807512 RepID=A0A7M2X1H0_9BACT|nr:hypothetical protein [Humisphaera borealis]QOV91514.1 hypothetical protein IPV69_09210 [Humisphaera borealis]
MLRNTHRFRLFFGLVLAGSTGPAWSAVTVTPTRVRETRVVALTKADANESRFFDRSELEITLKLSGPEMQDATEYKMPTITEATDDTGASLLPKDKPFSGFQQVQRDTFGSSPKKPPTTDVEIRTNLATAARKATTLKSVKGSLQIRAGGEKKQVVVKDVKSLAGKSIEDPALAAAKIGVKVEPAKPKSDRELALEITGDKSPIKSIEVVDAAGKVVSNGYSSFGFSGTTKYSVSLEKPLDASMSVRINMVIGQQLIDVPFEFKDLQLP